MAGVSKTTWTAPVKMGDGTTTSVTCRAVKNDEGAPWTIEYQDTDKVGGASWRPVTDLLAEDKPTKLWGSQIVPLLEALLP